MLQRPLGVRYGAPMTQIDSCRTAICANFPLRHDLANLVHKLPVLAVLPVPAATKHSRPHWASRTEMSRYVGHENQSLDRQRIVESGEQPLDGDCVCGWSHSEWMRSRGAIEHCRAAGRCRNSNH